MSEQPQIPDKINSNRSSQKDNEIPAELSDHGDSKINQDSVPDIKIEDAQNSHIAHPPINQTKPFPLSSPPKIPKKEENQQVLSTEPAADAIKKLENSKLYKKFMAEESKRVKASPIESRKDLTEKTGSKEKTPEKSINTYDVYQEDLSKKSRKQENTYEEPSILPPDSPEIPRRSPNKNPEILPCPEDKKDPENDKNIISPILQPQQNLASSISPMQSTAFFPNMPYPMVGQTNHVVNNTAQMQEIEHGMIIAQYESLMQQLTTQLEKQIKRNKELETVISAQAQKSTKLIETLRNHAEEEISEISQKFDKTVEENEFLKGRIDQLEGDRKKIILEKEQESQVASELKRKLDSDGANKVRMNQVEDELRKIISQVNTKNVSLEAELRKKDEEIFSINNHNSQLRTELNTQKEIIKQLKDDYAISLQKKADADAEIQKLMAKIYADETTIHKLSQENERISRTINSLTASKEAVENNMEEVKNENLELKQTLNVLEKEKTQLNAKLEKSYRDYQSLEIALMKAENTAQLQNETICELQKDYNLLIEREKQNAQNIPISPMKPPQAIKSAKETPSKKKMTPPKKTEQTQISKSESLKPEISQPVSEQEELKSRYKEYKMRQTASALGEVFKWKEPELAEKSLDKNKIDKYENEKELENEKTQIPINKPKSIQNTPPTEIRKIETQLVPLKQPIQPPVVTMPSNKKYEENKDQITKLQNNLQILLSEKQRLDKEYQKFGARAEKSAAQRKRKEEIEFELDLNEKNIQRIKHKLRELNAFS